MYYDYVLPVDSGISVRWTQWRGIWLSCDIDDRQDYWEGLTKESAKILRYLVTN